MEGINPPCVPLGGALEVKGIVKNLMQGFLKLFFPFMTVFRVILCSFQAIMTSLWREWAHDSQELLMQNDLTCILALRHYGLLKYAKLELMKGKEDLLRWIIQHWDEHEQVFKIGDQELVIDHDDIYFLTSFSCHVGQENLTGGRPDP